MAVGRLLRHKPDLHRSRLAASFQPSLWVEAAWYCFRNDDWERGLPYLAKGSDSGLKSLAELDIAVPSDPTKQTELGDGWSEQAQRTSDTANANVFRRRAYHWYTSALPNLTGLAKLAVEKKLDALRSEIESVKEPDTSFNLGSSTRDSEQFLVDFVRRFIEELRRIAQLDTDAQKRVEHAKAMDRFGAEMKRHTLVFRFPIENIVRENDGRGYLLRLGRPMGLGDMEEQIRYEDEARHVDLQESKALSLGRGAVCEIRGKGRFVLDRRELPLQERGAWWVLSIYPRVPGIESGRYDVFLVNGRVAYKSLDSTDEARSQTP